MLAERVEQRRAVVERQRAVLAVDPQPDVAHRRVGVVVGPLDQDEDSPVSWCSLKSAPVESMASAMRP